MLYPNLKDSKPLKRQLGGFLGFCLLGSMGCSQGGSPIASQEVSPATGQGILEFRANGEDFVRQGFESKDGWQIEFDQLIVSLQAVKAYQTEPAYDPDTSASLNVIEKVAIEQPIAVDLALGDEVAEPILVDSLAVPAGQFNALSWQLTSQAGPSLILVGAATQGDQIVSFDIALNPSVEFMCGDFVGDQRKGIVEAGGTADIELTFHFDHFFGDGDLPAKDDLNQGALGFEPLAALAEDGRLKLDERALEAELSEADYQRLQALILTLGHVGEGHCNATEVE